MEQKDTKSSISISRIFKVVFHRPILLSIVTFCITIICTLGLHFISKNKATYESQFTYSIPSMQEDKYIDGSKYYFLPIFKRDNLIKIKESNQLYNSVNIDKFLSSKLIEIKEVTEYSEITKEEISKYYSIVIPKSAFKNKSQAESFINEVIKTPITYSVEAQKNINYLNNISNFENAYSYNMQVDCLSKQYDLLIQKYESLISQYGNILINNHQLSDYLNDIKLFFLTNSLSDLQIEINQKGYVKDKDKEKETLELQREDLNKKLSYNEDKIDELKQMISFLINGASSNLNSLDLDSYNQKITELIIENSKIKQELESIDNKLSTLTDASPSFISKLNFYKEALIKFTNTYSTNENIAISEHSSINYKNQKILNENSTSIIKDGIIALVIGLVTGCVINFVLDYKYLYIEFPKKEEK
ncbi:MAG: hypothetical protein ACI318_00410 [Bacilli bacterium]|uniref:hypothetical protein n=1 Tax=Intestinibacter sp. TaxID=1965304 RepID=UPI003F0DCE91